MVWRSASSLLTSASCGFNRFFICDRDGLFLLATAAADGGSPLESDIRLDMLHLAGLGLSTMISSGVLCMCVCLYLRGVASGSLVCVCRGLYPNQTGCLEARNDGRCARGTNAQLQRGSNEGRSTNNGQRKRTRNKGQPSADNEGTEHRTTTVRACLSVCLYRREREGAGWLAVWDFSQAACCARKNARRCGHTHHSHRRRNRRMHQGST